MRDSIPLTPPQTIRALDSVQRLFAAGRPSAGLADTLARQGISYVVVRNDLDPETSRSARPVLVHRAIDGSPGLSKVAEFGEPVGPGTLAGFITDSGLRPKYPAVEIYRVDAADAQPGAPYLTDTDAMARVDGGPEALLRLDERRRLLDQPPLGPMLLTADAQRAGLPTPVVTVTDTPLARETDYGRVDDHSSAIRAEGDARHTFNRVPDYPAGDIPTLHGDWTGGRITVSSSAADSTALPNVAPATGPTAAIDSDPSTSWVSNALQSAVGQWLQVDFDHPVTNATITVTPSATAVGAQVRRIEISTVNGTSTLRFDEAGKPLTAALPYGETPWVRITAVGTDDGSPGVQFGITDFTVTQYDASGFAHPIELRHTVVGARSTTELRCRTVGSGVRAARPFRLRRRARRRALRGGDGAVAGGAGEPEPHADGARTDIGDADGVGAAAPGPQPRRPDPPAGDRTSARVTPTRSTCSARSTRPPTATRAPRGPRRSGVVQHRTPPNLTLKLPVRTRGDRLAADAEFLDAARTSDAGGDRPRGRPAGATAERRRRTQTVTLRPKVTDTVKVSILDWDDVIDRTALGFDQIKPPGLAEITALDAQGRPIDAADAARNRDRAVDAAVRPRTDHRRRGSVRPDRRSTPRSVRCSTATRFRPRPCRPAPIALPAGQQELLISPGAAFVVDGVQLVGPLGRQLPSAATIPAAVATWSADHREVDVPSSQASRMLVVPESINPGWIARTADGAQLTPVTVNGWQQGWVVPSGTSGAIVLSFGSNAVYRAGIVGGLALLPILALLALVPARRPPPPADPARPWRPGVIATGSAVLAVGGVISGIVGVVVVGAALGARHLLRNRPRACEAVTVGTSAGGLILAGAVLSQNPWRSVDGYAGHSAGVQLLALISIAAVAASTLSGDDSPPDRPRRRLRRWRRNPRPPAELPRPSTSPAAF